MVDNNAFALALDALMCKEPLDKIKKVNKLKLNIDSDICSFKPIKVIDIDVPGRPLLPKLVFPKDLPRRRLGTMEGKAALLHSLAHIEFNAINLALDAVYRFQKMPKDYYKDWIKIAFEEAYHFKLISDYLTDLGYNYGSFVAHNSLWEMAVNTNYDVMVRMALVPRLMEARGLDVTPSIIKKFKSLKDNRAVEILSIIQNDEIGHVFIGNKWYFKLCEERKHDPLQKFKELLDLHAQGFLKPPFSMENRKKAGFTNEELSFLENIA